MQIKSINKIKEWWRVTIFQNDLKTKQVIIECDNLEWLVDKIRIYMIEYREKRMKNCWNDKERYEVSGEVHKEWKSIDF